MIVNYSFYLLMVVSAWVVLKRFYFYEIIGLLLWGVEKVYEGIMAIV